MNVEQGRRRGANSKDRGSALVLRRALGTWLLAAVVLAWAGGAALALGLGRLSIVQQLLVLLAIPAVLALPLWRAAASAARRLATPVDRLLALEDGVAAVPRALVELEQACDRVAGELVDRMQSDAATILELRRSRDDAASASLAKSQFLASMSHELRTPLNAIIGYSTLMQEEAVAAGRTQEEQDLGRVLGASRRLLGLINDILELSRIEAGRTALERSIVDVASLAQSAAASFDPVRDGNLNRLEIEVADDVGILLGDAGKIRQCLLNLIGNALKFTREGEVRLTVRAAQRGGVDTVEFEIADSGVGMTPEQIDQLFHDRCEPTIGGPSTAPKLGLVITHRLATMMGGAIAVRSIVNEGSVFTLSIPRDTPRDAPDGDVPAVAPAATSRRAVAEKTALVIDDDPTAIDIMRRWLSRFGYAVIAANDGPGGLALARSERPDVIILDIFMPGPSGYDVLEAIRADAALAAIPVIVVSVSDDRARTIGCGASDMLMKPVPPERLRDVLDVYCKRIDGEVLVIEDDADAGELIRRSAAQIGLGAVLATSGEQGLEIARARLPAAIVLDLGLPGMNGFDVLAAIEADPRLKDIPVLIVSGREISVSEHRAITQARGIYHPKGYATPRQIAESLRMAVAR